jgi:hypothetical protein
MSKPLLSTLEVSRWLSDPCTILHKPTKQGRVRSDFVAMAWMFRQHELDAYLERMTLGRGYLVTDSF